MIGIDASDAIGVSAKTGLNVAAVLEAIVERLPPPKGERDVPLKAMLIDSWYDTYLGVVVLLRVREGVLRRGQRIKLMSTDAGYTAERVGIFRPKQEMLEELGPGEVGFFTAGIKQVADTRVGDTIIDEKNTNAEPLPGFKPAQPVVFCGLFPVDAADFQDLREAMSKLRLNDASFSYETETSAALGFGFRCGFLGLLHLEIITERLEREFNLDLITTAPSVIYKMHMNDGTMLDMHNPADMPDVMKIKHIDEPWIEATILVPDDYLGAVLKLCQDRRGRQKNLTYVGSRAMLVYELPLNEVVFDFYDRLKSVSRGYASFDYKIIGHELGDAVGFSDTLLAGHYLDEFAQIHYKDMVVREALDHSMPAAGVGCAFSRRAFESTASKQNNELFNTGSLTEDYDFGFRLKELGLRQAFVKFFTRRPVLRRNPLTGRERLVEVRELVGVREYFPHTLRTAVRRFQSLTFQCRIGLAVANFLPFSASW